MVINKIERVFLASKFQYPKELKKVINLNLINIEPWLIITDARQMEIIYNGMKERYPNRNLIPFARRIDSDDTACFEVGEGEEVHIIHNFASSGWEQRKIYENFSEWFKEAISEMLMWDDE